MLLLQPRRWLHLREISRLTDGTAGTMKKELDRLHGAGLLEKRRFGNQLQFTANPQHPVFPELSALLRKTVGLADVLTQALLPAADRIKAAFVFGSVARSADTADSDVDVMIIGDLDFGEAVNLLYESQTDLHREINPKVFGAEERCSKLEAMSSFIENRAITRRRFSVCPTPWGLTLPRSGYLMACESSATCLTTTAKL